MDWSVFAVVLLALAVAVTAHRPGRRPRAERPPRRRWRSRLAGRLERTAGRLRSGGDAPDPFEVLRLQTRLGVVADQVRLLEGDDRVYAKAARLRATQAAYDDLLEEACRLAGVPVQREGRRREQERLREEVELASRGWSW